MNGLIRRILRRYGKSQDGAAAVEFAMVAAPFFFVLGSIAETGLMLFTEYAIQNAVQGAGRLIRTHQAAAVDGTVLMSDAEFKTALCSKMTSLIDCDGSVTVHVESASDFATLQASIPSYIDIGAGGPSSYDPGAAGETVGVIATYDWDFAFPFMDFLGNIDGDSKRRLHGIAVFVNEP